MAGQRDRVNVVARALPAGERGAEDRGLREARGLVDLVERVLADQRRDLRDEIGPHSGDELPHPRLLAALSREQDGGGGGFKHTLTVALVSTPHKRFPP